MWRRPPDAVVGFGSQRIMEDVMSNGSGLSRGDRNRNARLARLRELVPLSNAIVGIDLADGTQAAVVTDHDSRVIARRRVSVRAWLDARAGRGRAQHQCHDDGAAGYRKEVRHRVDGRRRHLPPGHGLGLGWPSRCRANTHQLDPRRVRSRDAGCRVLGGPGPADSPAASRVTPQPR
jgi:cyanophycinase-like exopeptidase